jgi:hypothetical protein
MRNWRNSLIQPFSRALVQTHRVGYEGERKETGNKLVKGRWGEKGYYQRLWSHWTLLITHLPREGESWGEQGVRVVEKEKERGGKRCLDSWRVGVMVRRDKLCERVEAYMYC